MRRIVSFLLATVLTFSQGTVSFAAESLDYAAEDASAEASVESSALADSEETDSSLEAGSEEASGDENEEVSEVNDNILPEDIDEDESGEAATEASSEESEAAIEASSEEVLVTDSEDYIEIDESAGGNVLMANGGRFPDGNTEYYMNTASEVICYSYYIPDREGYAFNGWYYDAKGEHRASLDSRPYELAKAPKKGTILYANWTADYHTLTYVFDGDTAPYSGGSYYFNRIDMNGLYKKLVYKLPSGFTIMDDYYPGQCDEVLNEDHHYSADVFSSGNYWYTDPERKNKNTIYPIKGHVLEDDLTLYAGFVKNATLVTLKSCDDTGYFKYPCLNVNYSGGSALNGVYETADVRLAETSDYGVGVWDYFNLPSTEFEVKNYLGNSDGSKVFTGWFYDKECTQPLESNKLSYSSEDKVIYAGWETKYKVLSLDPNGGFFYTTSNTTINKSQKYTDPLTLPIKKSEEDSYVRSDFVISNKRNYKFLGWASSPTAKKAEVGSPYKTGKESDNCYFITFNSSFDKNKDKTLYAVWEKTGEEEVNAVTLDTKTASLIAREGAALTVNATVTGEDIYEKVVEWTITDDDDAIDVVSVKNKAPDGRILEIIPNPLVEKESKATLLAKVTADDGEVYEDSCIITVRPQPTAAAPVSSITKTSVKKGTKVSLSTSTPYAEIYYRIGSDIEEHLYKDVFVIDKDTEITAYTKRTGYKDSEEKTFSYTVEKNEWGEITDPAVRALFEDSSEVPSGIWYMIKDDADAFGNPDSDAVRLYTEGGEVSRCVYYTGNAITFDGAVDVYHGTTKLVKNRDYTLKYANNKAAAGTDAGKKAPSLTITGKGNYANKAVFKFTIAKAPLSYAEVTSEYKLAVFAGNKTKLSSVKPVISYNGKKLTLNKDYVLKFYKASEFTDGNEVPASTALKNAGETYYVLPVAKNTGNFAGSMTDEQAIVVCVTESKTTVPVGKLKTVNASGKAVKVDYDSENTVDVVSLFDNSEGKTPSAFVKDGKKTLTFGTDYVVKALPEDDYKSAGTHRFALIGLGQDLSADDIKAGKKSYVGEKVMTFEISGVSMKSVKIAGLLTSVQYTGSAIELTDLFNANDKVVKSRNEAIDKGAPGEKVTEPLLYYSQKVKSGKKTVTMLVPLTAGIDYTYSLEKIVNAGKVTLSFTGKGKFAGRISKTITVKAYDLKKDAGHNLVVKVDPATYEKNGARPAVTVSFITKKDAEGNAVATMPMREGVDYTVSCSNNSKVFDDENKLKDSKVKGKPTVTIKGKGNFAGANATTYFVINKANVSRLSLSASDVVYNAKGKKGYFLVNPKILDGTKAVSLGKNKDVETLSKKDYKYYYAEDTVVNGRTKGEGTEVAATDMPSEGTLIEVKATVKCSAKSPYVSEKDGTVLKGYYRIIGSGKDISKFSAKVVDASSLSFDDCNEIIPVKSKDIVVSYKVKGKKTPVVLDPDCYEVLSVTNNRYIGTATVTIRGKKPYGGVKTITFKITAKKLK